ncbi:MAG: DUF362 domain-containing protein [candidate division KSB1 bacterium]|nr:DUF362 domain-containing protein [candidate division KSB1 bacterium]
MSEKKNCHGPFHRNEKGKSDGLSRRQFVAALGAAAAGITAAACSRASLPLEPNVSAAKGPLVPPTGSLGRQGGHLAQVAVCDVADYSYQALRANIQSAVEALGGLSDICKPGDVVGIKLNMTGGDSNAKNCPKRYGVKATELYWTHPEILRVCMELFRDAGASRIIVMEAIYDNESYQKYGYRDVVEELGGDFVDLNKKSPYGSFKEVPVPSPLGRWDRYYHNQALHELDCFVSLPKAKRHYGAGVTHSLKNMVGSIPLSIYTNYNDGKEGAVGGYRASMHEMGWPTLVRNFLDICRIRPIHFAINDAIMTADNGEGPWNQGFTPARYNKLIIGKDPVAVDSISTQVIGWDPMVGDFEGCFSQDSLPGEFSGTDNYLRIAQEAGMGIYDVNLINVINATASTRVVKRG